ncbi:putative dihydrofolate reductase isoform X2 [Amphibalanus amphitrite]|uniref:putative dihydrofolate reductase isoform X2 n=1 Tax=Amphibalanus amphitrite TaxID=1232801 RepID=UPI001C91F38A|nr:putative dihydrofolate reductase isoform X2 [Amphibalanus amphitrite]XP_043225629.1 putative dihydrofolate reductase isoform X2 [Amphibalanus amphitrite]XP_043225630.1 putative dihydrofolate reductase isoform X2 [Amphibalanus amphitrite]XP_043225631.1 putative dihydrofolate reductase isoform X2 [Amphibalanus amphitrite]XP_043225632.1 putative dihydrofolate reductase isoform X2 [Amphibalanus amphitrite]XP_043225633.1 putative dihydrofolate reductase isoform X2 [Amphibalanus amphitrite]
MRKMNIVAAMASNRGIGCNGDLPWRLKKEFKHFTSLIRRLDDPSKKNAVILGRKTWESVPATSRPIKGKINVIVTSQADYTASGEDVYVAHSLEEAMTLLSSPPLSDTVETVWNLGGSYIYKEAIDKKLVDKMYLTRIRKEFDADVFFPLYSDDDFEPARTR